MAFAVAAETVKSTHFRSPVHADGRALEQIETLLANPRALSVARSLANRSGRQTYPNIPEAHFDRTARRVRCLAAKQVGTVENKCVSL